MARLEAPRADSKLVAKNTLVLYLRMLVVMAVGLFTSRVQLQALGVDDYGLYQVAMATVVMLSFMKGSLGMASSRFLTVEMGKGTIGSVKRLFSTVLGVHFALALVLALLLETVGLFVLGAKLNISADRLFAVKWAYQCAVLSTVLGVTQVPYTAVIIAHERMSAFAYMTFYDVGVKLLICYLLFISPFDRLIFYATLLLASSCTTIAIYRIYCIRHFTESRFRRVFDVRIVKSMSSFVGWQLLSQVVCMMIIQMVTLLNQRYFGPAIVAASTVGASVFGQVNGFICNFKMAANPQIIKLYAAREFDMAKSLVIDAIHYSAFLLLILGVPIWFYAPEILHLWLGENVPPYAVEFLRVILCGAFFTNFDHSMFTVITADGRMRANTLCDLLVYSTTFVLIWIAIRIFGCRYTTAIGQGLAAVVMATCVKPLILHRMARYRFVDFLRMYSPAVIALVGCVAVTYGLYVVLPNTVWLLVPNCALAALLNAFIIISFVASESVQNQALNILGRFGSVGGRLSSLTAAYLCRVRKSRMIAAEIVLPILRGR